jgi:hypothetical protein
MNIADEVNEEGQVAGASVEWRSIPLEDEPVRDADG